MRILDFRLSAILFAVTAASAETDLLGPKIVDVGHARINEIKKFAFSLENASDAEIKITTVKTSCSCIKLQLDGAEKLTPGAKRTIIAHVAFGANIGVYQGMVNIAYRTEGGHPKQIAIPIRGKAVAPIVLEKPVIDFGDVDLNASPQSMTIEIMRGNSGEAWDSIEAVGGSEHPNVTVQADSDLPLRLAVRLDPLGLPISTYRRVIKLRLLYDGRPLLYEIELPVTARIKGPIKVVPASIYLGAMAPGTAHDRLIELSSSHLDLTEVTIEKQPESGFAEIVYADNNAARIKLRVIANIHKKVLTETLALIHQSSGVRIYIPLIGGLKNDNAQ